MEVIRSIFFILKLLKKKIKLYYNKIFLLLKTLFINYSLLYVFNIVFCDLFKNV